MGNKNNGVEVDGAAHDIDIGGPKLTLNVIPHNVISGNGGNGVAITGSAHNVHVNYSDIGTNITRLVGLGNVGAGVVVGPRTPSNTIGSLEPILRTVISGNGRGRRQKGGDTPHTTIRST